MKEQKKRPAVYLHLGGKKICFMHDIIAVINTEKGISPDTADLMDKAEAYGRLYEVEEGALMKSLILTEKGLYRSPIASSTLYKRAMNEIREGKEE